MKKTSSYILTAAAAVLMFASCEKTSVDEMVVSAPVVETFAPADGYSGCEITVKGSSLHNVVGAKIGETEATIAQRVSDTQIVIRVPATALTGRISLTNSVGTGSSASDFVVTYPAPVADASMLPEVVELYSNLLIYGSKMNMVNRVFFSTTADDAQEAAILNRNDNEIVVKVPAIQAEQANISFEYFNGTGMTLTNPSDLPVRLNGEAAPDVMVWKDQTLWAQGRDVEEFTSFFSPQTGIAYANSMWRNLDPVSYKYQAATCSEPQVPAVSKDEYDSVVPYFFFTGVSAGHLQINSPAGSASMLKNIFTENNSSSEFRVTGNSGDCYGTPVLSFLTLDESNSAHAELINKIKNGTLTDLDEQTYPLDVANKKIGNISVSSMSNSLNNTKYAPGVFTVGKPLDTDLDAYVLVLYYNEKGLDSSNKAANVRRMGVIHIKHINFRQYNGTDAPSSSAVTFDMYWMTKDYSNS